MGSVFRPTYTRPIPQNAERCTHRGKPAVRWRGRSRSWVYGILLTSNPAKCLVESSIHWVKFRTHDGKYGKLRAFRDYQASRNELVRVERIHEQIAAGILPVEVLSIDKTSSDHLADYATFLRSKGSSGDHVTQTESRIAAILDGTRSPRLTDISLPRVSAWIAEQITADTIGLSTANGYIRAVRSFTRWLANQGRLSANPLAGLQLRNADEDRRVVRRALSHEDFIRLVETTARSRKSVRSMDGSSRSALYLLAGYSGFRASEIVTVTRGSFAVDPNSGSVFVTMEASESKSGRDRVVPLPPGVVRHLFDWIGDRPTDEPLWPRSWADEGRGAEVLRVDLRAAGIPEIVDGERYDFHALRGQFITALIRAGVPLADAQALAGHSSSDVTARHYVRLRIADLAKQTAKLPDFFSAGE